MRSLFIFILVFGFFFGCNSQTKEEKPETLATQEEARKVEIYDHGLKMRIATITLPQKWIIEQDIATDPNTGDSNRYKYVLIGPNNQYVRSYLGQFLYGNINNVPYQKAINQGIDHVIAVEELENVQFTAFEPNIQTMQDPRFISMSERLKGRGVVLEAFKTEFSGQRKGKEYKGLIILINMYNPNGGFGILSPSSMMFSPSEFYQETLAIVEEINKKRDLNPEYDQTMAQISYRVQQRADAYSQQQINQSAAAHQRRMADRNAAFASHQKNMAGLNQIQDIGHANYLESLRETGTFNSIGNDYSSQENLVDQIHDRQSFSDPWTDKTISLDGQYEYNYTNGLGDYYRTNDANFNHHSLQGDWKPVKPLDN